jgi:hypothetical protein
LEILEHPGNLWGLSAALRLDSLLDARSALAVALLFAAAMAPGAARAQDAQVESGCLAPMPPFDNTVRGAIADGGIGTAMVGDSLMFELGGQWTGMRSRGRRWLLQWDAQLAARGGYLANEHPYLFLIGGHELAWAELGRRFAASSTWSAYAGTRAGNELFLMKHPGLAWSELNTVNNVDGVGGTVASGLIRLDAGASFLKDERSLLLVVFVQEELHAAETNTPAQAFAGVGVGARLDLPRSVAASAEASWGVAPERRDSMRGFTDRTTHVAASLGMRKTFRNGMWASLSTFIARDSDHMVYFAAGNVYDTTNAPQFGATMIYGVPVESYFK